MIFHILLINLVSPLFAQNELAKPLPLEAPEPIGSSLQTLPQIDADYAEDLMQDTKAYNNFNTRVNNDKDISRYCPHIEIISRLLNTLSKLPQGDTRIKETLAQYYSLLINTLNYRQDASTVNDNMNVQTQLHAINALAEKILMSKNENVKIKLSFEYELPRLQKNQCQQLCNALEDYANAINSRAVNYDGVKNTMETYERPDITFPPQPSNFNTDNRARKPLSLILPNYDLQNLNPPSDSGYAKLLYLQSLQKFLPSPQYPKVNKYRNPLQNILPVQKDLNSLLPPYVRPIPTTDNSKYDPLNNLLPLIQNPTNSYPIQNLGPSPLSPSSQYLPTLESNPLDISNMPMLPNPRGIGNNNPLQNFLLYPLNTKESLSPYPLKNLKLPNTIPTELLNNNPLSNLQKQTGPEGLYPEQYSPIHIPGTTTTLNANPLQNPIPVLQKPVDTDNSNNLQNMIPLIQNIDSSLILDSQPSSPNSDLSPNLLPLLQRIPGTSNYFPLQNVLPPNSRGNDNPSPLTNPFTSYLQEIHMQPPNSYPSQNLLPVALKATDPSNQLQILQALLNQRGNVDSNLSQLNSNPLQKLVLPTQTTAETQNLLQNISQSLQSVSGSTGFEEYLKELNKKHLDIQSSQNQNIQKYNYINLDSTQSRDQLSDISSGLLNKLYNPANPTYNENDVMLKGNRNQLYEKLQQQVNSASYVSESPILSYLANANAKLNTNLNEKQSADIELDSLSQMQANSFHYNQYTGQSDILYPGKNQLIRNPLNQEIQDASMYLPSSLVLNNTLNNALYNSYGQNLNQLQTNSYNRLLPSPNSYYNSNLNNVNALSADKASQDYILQLQHLHRLMAVSNLYKLNSVPNNNGIVELTYKLKHEKPILDPYYYVKYRLPYQTFLSNLKNLLVRVPHLRNSPNHDILMGSDISEASKDLKHVNKDELFKLVTSNGTLVTAKLVQANNSNLDKNLKIAQRLNANMPLGDLVKTDISVSNLSRQINNPLTNYLKSHENYLNDLQKSLAINKYKANRSYPRYLTNREPPYSSIAAIKYPVNLGINKYSPRNVHQQG